MVAAHGWGRADGAPGGGQAAGELEDPDVPEPPEDVDGLEVDEDSVLAEVVVEVLDEWLVRCLVPEPDRESVR
ncbi:MAG: hypothetical protein ACTMIR_10560 [Cellulomonadaceae bacterium]